MRLVLGIRRRAMIEDACTSGLIVLCHVNSSPECIDHGIRLHPTGVFLIQGTDFMSFLFEFTGNKNRVGNVTSL